MNVGPHSRGPVSTSPKRRQRQPGLLERLRGAHALCDEHPDVATASLVEERIDQGERRVWFLFEADRQVKAAT